MTFSDQLKELFYALNAKDKYLDRDSRKSFNRINKPEAATALLGAAHANDSAASLTAAAPQGIHEVRLAWRHIKKWLHKHSEDLNNLLLDACTEADLSELQKDLGCSLPPCVVEFLRMTGGQSTFNLNGASGLFYGLRLLPVDEIALMTDNWRKLHDTFAQELAARPVKSKETPLDTEPLDTESDLGTERSSTDKLADKLSDKLSTRASSDSSKATPQKATSIEPDLAAQAGFTRRVSKKLPPQGAIPPDAVLPVYTHPMWIPLIADGSGNFIGVDLSATTADSSVPAAVQGQMIIFGHDFDVKIRVADTFGDFLLQFANDLEKGNWDLRSLSDTEDMISGVDTDLVFVDHETKRELPYLEVLRDRAVAQWTALLPEEQRLLKAVTDLVASACSRRRDRPLASADRWINENLRGIEANGADLVEE